MGKTARIGLFFSYNEEWIAGTYYILNLIKALKLLPSPDQPEIVIITKEKRHYTYVVKETAYPKLSYCIYPIQASKYTILDRVVNKIGYILLKKKIINKTLRKADINFLYPYYLEGISFKPLNRVEWIPDFQELYLPHLFDKTILEKRKNQQEDIANHGDCLVVSSNDAKKDFYKLCPNAKVDVYTLSFAVTHPNFENQSISNLLNKYLIPKKFYFAPNQFWAHKNHIVILKALTILRKNDEDCIVVFTGNENDPRNLNYVSSLKNYVKENGIEKMVYFLGFIAREEQLTLMKNSVAVIQPSKFEGWSTVVEDCKALNKFIIASSIDVHKEQTQNNIKFFDPDSPIELAKYMSDFWNKKPEIMTLDYQKKRIKFAREFMCLVNKFSNLKSE